MFSLSGEARRKNLTELDPKTSSEGSLYSNWLLPRRQPEITPSWNARDRNRPSIVLLHASLIEGDHHPSRRCSAPPKPRQDPVVLLSDGRLSDARRLAKAKSASASEGFLWPAEYQVRTPGMQEARRTLTGTARSWGIAEFTAPGLTPRCITIGTFWTGKLDLACVIYSVLSTTPSSVPRSIYSADSGL